jgi:hypothetical protein
MIGARAKAAPAAAKPGRTEVVLEPRLHRDYGGRGRTAMSTKIETTRCPECGAGTRRPAAPVPATGRTQPPDAARGRPPVGERAMTPAERKRRQCAAQKKDKA